MGLDFSHNNKLNFFNTVTMQAQDTAPSDFPCNDKFLIQSTIVPKGTKEEQVQSSDLCNIQGNIDSRNIQHILTQVQSSDLCNQVYPDEQRIQDPNSRSTMNNSRSKLRKWYIQMNNEQFRKRTSRSKFKTR